MTDAEMPDPAKRRREDEEPSPAKKPATEIQHPEEPAALLPLSEAPPPSPTADGAAGPRVPSPAGQTKTTLFTGATGNTPRAAQVDFASPTADEYDSDGDAIVADDSTALHPVCIFIATNHSFTDRAAAVKNKDAATVVANDAFAKATAIMGSAGETRFLVIGSASASAPVAIMNVTADQLQRLLTASGDATIGMYTYAFKPKVTRAPTVELSRNHATILVLMPDAASKVTNKLECEITPGPNDKECKIYEILPKLPEYFKMKMSSRRRGGRGGG